MRRKSKVLLAAGALTAAALAFRFASDYLDRDSIPHESIQYALEAFGQAIYEYHQKTGAWPQSSEDLGGAGLGYWREMAKIIDVVPHNDLKDDPRENAAAVIAYYRGGFFPKMGRVWV
jgi:hypothetical protein